MLNELGGGAVAPPTSGTPAGGAKGAPSDAHAVKVQEHRPRINGTEFGEALERNDQHGRFASRVRAFRLEEGDGHRTTQLTARPLTATAVKGDRDAEAHDAKRDYDAALKAAHQLPGNDFSLNKRASGAAQRYDQAQAFNGMVQVMHALGADQKTLDALDGGVKLQVVPDSQIESSAEYVPAKKAVLVRQSTIDEAFRGVAQLREDGILDEFGRVKEGKLLDLDRSGVADRLVTVGNLIGAHEAMHADQDAKGLLASNEAALKSGRTSLVPFEAELTELKRIESEELPAYRHEELEDFNMGAHVRVLLTIDRDGQPLPDILATKNIQALQDGDPLPYGPDAGWQRPDHVHTRPTGIFATGSGGDDAATPGWMRPGWMRPGWMRPGWMRPGFSRE